MATSTIKLGFVGAGAVNFGGGEGPWSHAARLERLCTEGYQIEVVGIADVDLARMEWVLTNQRKITQNPSMWSNTQLYTSYVELLDQAKPDALFIGVPPEFHGTTLPGRDVEVQCAKRKVHMFIEKPLSCYPEEEVHRVDDIVAKAEEEGLVVSVGYMFRYSKAVLKMKEVIQTYGEPRAFNARYDCAYSNINKESWWHVDKSGGPIVEQATHFCDLARFLIGEADLNTVQALSIKQTDRGSNLSSISSSVNENNIPPEKRIPRVTNACWKFKNGAIGNLMHGVLLHQNKYENSLEVWGDGYIMTLTDPYHKCKVAVRLPHSEDETVYHFGDDDYYYNEDLVFLKMLAAKKSNTPTDVSIKSTYADAFNTYQLSWMIRVKSEQSQL